MSRVRTGESVLARGVRVIESFRMDDVTLSVSDIARRSGLHVATASRLVEELTAVGWLEREGRRVRLGVRLWEVVSRASSAVGLRAAAKPFMEDLLAITGHHTQLSVLEGDEVMFIERLSRPGAAVNYTRVAGRGPLHATSSGLVLLAHASEALQERIFGQPLRAYTDKTLTTERRLRSALAEVRRQDHAFCAGHIHPETTGIAVPLRDARGDVVAALSVLVPNDDAAQALVPTLQAAGRAVSRVMYTASNSNSDR